MRVFPTFQLPKCAKQIANVVMVVIGMLSIVSMLGAGPRHEKKPSLRSIVQFPQVRPSAIAPTSAKELLHDVSDMSAKPVRQDDLVVRKVSMEVTAYCPCNKCCGPNAIGITASGRDTTYNSSRFAAADPSIPFGTKLLVPGYSEHAVEVIDRGSAIRGDKIDVFFASHEAALEWGRRRVEVTILQ